MAKINQRMDGHYDRRNQRCCNKQRHCDAGAIPGWTMGHYAVADLALHTSRAPALPSRPGWPALSWGDKRVTWGNDFPGRRLHV